MTTIERFVPTRARPARGQQTVPMLVLVTRLTRAGATVLIGVLTFAGSSVGRQAPLEITAYVISVIAVTLWLLRDHSGRSEHDLALSVALGVMAIAAGITTTAPNGAAFIGFSIIAALDAGTDSDLLTGWVLTGVAVVALEAGALIHSSDTASVLGYPMLVVLSFISGRNRRAYLLQAHQSAAMVVQLQQLRAEQRQVAILDERTRIAREIHDVLAHSLGSLGIQIQAARAVLEEDDVPRALSLLDQAQRMAGDGLVETRRAVQALRGDAGRLDEQIDALLIKHRAQHPGEVNFELGGSPVHLAPEATVALIRTAQEALVNTAKHAPHQPVQIRLRYADDEVELVISNPLAGVRDAGQTTFSTLDGGYGLTGMRERLLLIHGGLSAGIVDGQWVVAARVPR
jgi:signal transduction histidine kinase